MIKRLQNRIATSRMTLPITCAYGGLLLIIFDYWKDSRLIPSILIAASTFLMFVLNNSNSLIRIYSRLVSCSYLVLTIATLSIAPQKEVFINQFLFILVILQLFRAYQNRYGMGIIYYCFLFLGLISTTFSQIVFYIPIIWLMLGTSLQAASLKNYCASILGLLTPYWFWFPYALWNGTEDIVISHICSVTEFRPLFEGLFEIHLFTTLTFLVILITTGIVHYLHYSYADSIKVRMFYNTFIMLLIASVAFIILQPGQAPNLLYIIIICGAPLIAHYFTFTNSWLTNASFIAITIATIALTVFNQWISL